MNIVSQCKIKNRKKNFESHNSLKLGLHSNFVECESFLELNSSWHSCSMWNKLRWLNWFWQFLCDTLSSFNPKAIYYSYSWSCSLFEGRTSFCIVLISRKLCRFLLMFHLFTYVQLALLHSVLHLFPLSITLLVFKHSFWFYLT